MPELDKLIDDGGYPTDEPVPHLRQAFSLSRKKHPCLLSQLKHQLRFGPRKPSQPSVIPG
jgi:hypothetical protein